MAQNECAGLQLEFTHSAWPTLNPTILDLKSVIRCTDLYLLELSLCTPRREADSNPLPLPV